MHMTHQKREKEKNCLPLRDCLAWLSMALRMGKMLPKLKLSEPLVKKDRALNAGPQ